MKPVVPTIVVMLQLEFSSRKRYKNCLEGLRIKAQYHGNSVIQWLKVARYPWIGGVRGRQGESWSWYQIHRCVGKYHRSLHLQRIKSVMHQILVKIQEVNEKFLCFAKFRSFTPSLGGNYSQAQNCSLYKCCLRMDELQAWS